MTVLPIIHDAGPCTRARSTLLAALTKGIPEGTTFRGLRIGIDSSEPKRDLRRMLRMAVAIAKERRRCSTEAVVAA